MCSEVCIHHGVQLPVPLVVFVYMISCESISTAVVLLFSVFAIFSKQKKQLRHVHEGQSDLTRDMWRVPATWTAAADEAPVVAAAADSGAAACYVSSPDIVCVCLVVKMMPTHKGSSNMAGRMAHDEHNREHFSDQEMSCWHCSK